MRIPGAYQNQGVEDVISMNIIRAIANAEKIDVVELAIPLYEVIDLDALERLFQGTDGTARVTFQYEGWQVDVYGNGAVDVSKASERT